MSRARSPRKKTPATTEPEGGESLLRSKVTARSQTTLPSGVRKALGLRAGDEITYEVQGTRVIVRKRAAAEEQDPALGPFLDLLEEDVARNPERLRPATHEFVGRMRRLASPHPVDLDAPIEGDFQL